MIHALHVKVTSSVGLSQSAHVIAFLFMILVRVPLLVVLPGQVCCREGARVGEGLPVAVGPVSLHRRGGRSG